MNWFSRSQLTHLTEKDNIIWRLEISCGRGRTKRCTGFAVHSDGLIMCCAHIFDGMDMTRVVIQARKLTEETSNTARVLHIQTDWGLCMLKIDGLSGCEYGEFVSNGTLVIHQPICYIGNPFHLVGSHFFGRVSFPCVENVNLPTTTPTTRSTKCMKYTLPDCHENSPGYRIMGHYLNSERDETRESRFLGKLNYLIPIIECSGFIAEDFDCGTMFGEIEEDGQEGFSGGPIFDGDGSIVGMMFSNDYNRQIAIHVSLLKQFLTNALNLDKDGPSPDATR